MTQVASETAKENATPVEVFQQIGPSKQMNRLIALGSVVFAVGLFVSGRLEGVARPGLSQLSANAVPYEEVLHSSWFLVVESGRAECHTKSMLASIVLPSFLANARGHLCVPSKGC